MKNALVLLALVSLPAFADDWLKVTDFSKESLRVEVWAKDAHKHNGIASYKLHMILGESGVNPITGGDYMDFRTDTMSVDCDRFWTRNGPMKVVVYTKGVRDEAMTLIMQTKADANDGVAHRTTAIQIESEPSWKWACSLPES